MTLFGWSTSGALGVVIGYYGGRWYFRRRDRRRMRRTTLRGTRW